MSAFSRVIGQREPPPGMNKISVILAVAADVSADHAVSAAAMAQNSGAGAVAEKHARVAIGPVGDRCQFLGADHEDGVVGVRGDELLRDFKPKRKPAQAAEISRQAALVAPIFF